MNKRYFNDCWMTLGMAGGVAGVPTGAIIGFSLGGPFGAIAGGFLGASAGFVLGAGFGALLCWLIHGGERESWSFAKPRFTSQALHARPNPAVEDDSCAITIQFQVDGNDDRALCEITFEIEAEAANPPRAAPLPPMRSNATSCGRHTYPFFTKWSDPHDGRRVSGKLVLVATKDGQTYTIEQDVADIFVPVQPR